jgi:hypothetical protein
MNKLFNKDNISIDFNGLKYKIVIKNHLYQKRKDSDKFVRGYMFKNHNQYEELFLYALNNFELEDSIDQGKVVLKLKYAERTYNLFISLEKHVPVWDKDPYDVDIVVITCDEERDAHFNKVAAGMRKDTYGILDMREYTVKKSFLGTPYVVLDESFDNHFELIVGVTEVVSDRFGDLSKKIPTMIFFETILRKYFKNSSVSDRIWIPVNNGEFGVMKISIEKVDYNKYVLIVLNYYPEINNFVVKKLKEEMEGFPYINIKTKDFKVRKRERAGLKIVSKRKEN